MIFPNENDCAYAAGILDGEGCIQIYKRPLRKNKGRHGCNDVTPRFELQVAVGTTDRKIIYWMKDNFAGSSCQVKNPKGNRKTFRWSVTGTLAVQCLKKTLPFLKTKKIHALLAIEFYEKLIQGKTWKTKIIPKELIQKRQRIHEMMKLLNSGYDPEINGGYHD